MTAPACLRAGLHEISAEAYHADPCETPALSCSIAKILLARSPLHAWAAHPKLGNLPRAKGDDDKFDYGSACHDVLLEGGHKLAVLNPEDYKGARGGIPKGWTNDAIRAARDEARTAGKIPVLPTQANRIMKMVESANKFIQASDIADQWEDADSELTAIWQENGIWLKCRFDRISKSRSFIGDFKSTTDASPDTFTRHIGRMGYHIQDAFYRRAIGALGLPPPQFRFIAQEVSPPHACSMHECSTDIRIIAEQKVQQAIDIWAQCLSTGKWPGYGTQTTIAQPSNWMMEQALQEGVFDLGYREEA